MLFVGNFLRENTSATKLLASIMDTIMRLQGAKKVLFLKHEVCIILKRYPAKKELVKLSANCDTGA